MTFALEVLRGVLPLRLILPALLAAVVTATIVARTLDARSIYDARFTDREVRNLVRERKPPAG